MEPTASTSHCGLKKDRSLRNGGSTQGLRNDVSRSIADADYVEGPVPVD